MSPLATLSSRTPRAKRAMSPQARPLNSAAWPSRLHSRSSSGVGAPAGEALWSASLHTVSQWFMASTRELGIEHRQAGGKFVGLADDREAGRTEQMGQVTRTLAVDGDAERHDAPIARLDHGDASVLDTVAAVVEVEVVRFAVGQDEQDAARGGLLFQHLGGVADRCTEPGVVARLDRHDPSARAVVEALVEILQAMKAHVAALHRRKAA